MTNQEYPELNEFQTPLTDDFFADMPEECVQQFWDFFYSVPFIKWCTAKDRPRAKDLKRDSKGRIIIDVCHPPILEDMDYFTPAANHYRKHGCYTFLRPNGNKNSEYGRWIREERRRCWEGYVRESDGMWITGYNYFYANYVHIELSKKQGGKKALRVEDFPAWWEGAFLWFHYLEQARSGGMYNKWEGGQHAAQLAKRGAGKAISYDEWVLTPDGWKFWYQIQKGDRLFGDDGKPTTVVDIPYDDPHCGVYQIKLQDGRDLLVSDEHLMKVKWHNKICIKPLREMLNNYIIERTVNNKCTTRREWAYRVPVCECLQFPYKEIPIDPYTLGLLIGDGCFRTQKGHRVTFTADAQDIETYKKFIPYEFHKVTNDKFTYSISIDCNLFGDLWGTESEDKYIPEEYIYNSKDVRLNLLRGLLDSDGTVSKGNISLSTSSVRLKDDVITLVRTLGFNCNVSEEEPFYYKNGERISGSKNYIITIFADEKLFNLDRKQSKVRIKSNRHKWTAITEIKFFGYTGAKCVTVDNDSHCFVSGDQIVTHNSYSVASMLARNFVLGEADENRKSVMSVLAAYSKEYLAGKDGCLDKFKIMIDWCAETTQFPRLRLQDKNADMIWKMGYKDKETGVYKGSLNTVVGVSVKDDIGKIRGKRAALYCIEEFGSFKNLSQVYQNAIPSVQDGDYVFGQMVLIGTAGDKESDFAGASDIMYHPAGYNMYQLPNVYDKEGSGKKNFVYFFPGYICRTGCVDANGNSDVTKALKNILLERYQVKYNTDDPFNIIKKMAEVPIVPAEAIVSLTYNMFPSIDATNRIGQLDNNPTEFDNVLVGTLEQGANGDMQFKPSNDMPIRIFPTKDNKVKGAIEFYVLPEVDKKTGKVYSNRYIAGVDPYDNDQAESSSLGSIFVLDLFTDNIVCEYTGRPEFAADFYEVCRRICLFYNARCNYENNKKGLFTYFAQMNCTYLLTDTLDCVRDKLGSPKNVFGNCSKGTVASEPLNNWARALLRDWLIKPVEVASVDENGETVTTTVRKIFTVRNRALLMELAQYNSEGNFDRISSMGMLMLLREDRWIAYGGSPSDSRKRQENTKSVFDEDFLNSFDESTNSFLFD